MANGFDDKVTGKELNEKGCEYGRSLKLDLENLKKTIEGETGDMKKDIADIIENLQNRPSWPVAMTITMMASIIAGLAVALIAG